ncbi:aldehyde dehydrogenase (NADP(+)) [Ulvibacter litoralis]|uniref:NADP-dependent aldehyde dehydrogenase n=1 Tax=Ulvibacter litoralis TaxID=227084 RepID=A0A1G7CL20_9FLAO|nr:aldehyde dehydrogenase (NADP(+)) [Ulvibacter litoralis]GHC46991.1 aldehyde dehydrogenase [Ulvibacter litoralis]SDE39921.1 NADP-dependent aldehyde dehydrogenase [Ulvibacter litoralis]
MITGKNYIGSTLSSKGTKTYKTFNPQLNIENDITFSEATQEEINEAAALASEAFKTYRNVSGIQKAAFLNAIADEILALGDEAVKTYCSETGLPEGRAIGERGRTMGQLKAFAALLEEGSWVDAVIDTAQPERTPMPRSDIRKMQIAMGPVVVFGASNFAFAFSTAGGDTAAALAAGCPVIVKSHPMHAGTSELVASAILKAAKRTGMPEGVFSNVNSSGIEVGAQLVSHPAIKAVGFTGSYKGGKALYDLAAKRPEPIPVFAEMGSINPVVVLPEALTNRGTDLAKTYAGSVTLGTGQFCTNPGLLLGIKSDALTQFVKTLSETILTIDPSCMLHPNIATTYEANKQKALDQEGVTVTAQYDTKIKENYARQAVTTVDGSTFLENTQLHQEVFGPFTMVVQCDNVAQLETIISKLEGQLTGTILGEPSELPDYKNVIEALQNRVGRIVYNGVPTGVEVCPAMVHGGPFPATTDSRFTSVGVSSIQRWVRPFCFQDWPNALLPEELKNENPLGITRLVNSSVTSAKI